MCHEKLVFMVICRSSAAMEVQSFPGLLSFLEELLAVLAHHPCFLKPWMTEPDRLSHSEVAWFTLLHPYSGQNSHSLSLLLLCLFLKEGRISFHSFFWSSSPLHLCSAILPNFLLFTTILHTTILHQWLFFILLPLTKWWLPSISHLYALNHPWPLCLP